MAGVTNTGFVPKRLGEIITGLKESAVPIFQDLVPPGEAVDTSDTSTIGRLIGLVSTDLDELWQALQQVYQAFDPNSATGVALDNIVQYLGLTRRQGSPTVLRTSVWGQTNTFLPQGQVIRNVDGDRFTSTTQLTFSINDIIGFAVSPTTMVVGEEIGFTFIVQEGIYSVSYTVQAGDTVEDVLEAWEVELDTYGLERVNYYADNSKFYVVMKEYFAYITVPTLINSNVVEVKKRLTFNSNVQGDIPAPLNTVTTILTPVFGWLSVSNEISAEIGSVYETDQQLRERFRVSKAVRANNTSEALYSQLLELEDVDFVRVYENMSDITDIRGLPPHSFMAILRGGTDTDIGRVVWNNKPLGIASFGTSTVIVRDSQNMEREVKFSRATAVPVYVNVVVKKTDNTFPDDGIEQIRAAVVNYINTRNTFGEDVIYTRLFTPINKIPGHQVDTLEIGTSLITLDTTNIPMTWAEYPITLPEYVTVTLAP